MKKKSAEDSEQVLLAEAAKRTGATLSLLLTRGIKSTFTATIKILLLIEKI